MTARLALSPLSRSRARLVRRFAAPRTHGALWGALWIAVVAAQLGVLAPVLFGIVEFEPVDVVFRLVGGSFAACGLIAWRRRPDNHSGRLMTIAGFALFMVPLVGQLGSSIATTIGLWLSDLWVLFFVPLLLTLLTAGRLRTQADRALVGLILVAVLVLAPLGLMFDEEAEGNLFFVVADARLAGAIDAVQRAVFAAITVGAVAVLAARWRAASAPGRRAMLPGVAGAACLLLFTALLVNDLITGERSEVLLWIAACSLFAVPTAFLYGLLRSRLARGELADLFRGLHSIRPDELQGALAKALGDPALVIAYPRPDGTHLDAGGRPITLPAPGADRSVAIVERDGEQVAALVYDRSLDDDPELVEAVGGAATIALENQQLHAEAQARLAELQASRERIITAGDTERRRIERNLHDGAQQRLTTLALQLSLIQRQIRRDPTEAEQLVTLATDELAHSLEELRELARGIHPATLDQGLEPALDALALRSAVPTAVTCDPGPRLPEPVEFAAYFVASEALANVAKYAHATAATVRVRHTDAQVVIEIADDGVGGADPDAGTGLRGLADRIEAVHGKFRVAGPPGGGTIVTAEIPLPAGSTRRPAG